MIPGSFDIGSLQDEMTGVSLAGTQLRVNQYDMHDVEWNEVRVTTINGARVLDDKKDIHIPQVSERKAAFLCDEERTLLGAKCAGQFFAYL